MEGLNARFDVVRLTFQSDDVGGAVETGTFIARNVPGRLDVSMPSQQSLEQGLETTVIGNFILRPRPGTLTILERDQLILVRPIDHINFNQYWRIEGEVVSSSMHAKDRNQFLRMRGTRIERTRTEVLQ